MGMPWKIKPPNRLRELRKGHKFTLEQLAEDANTSCQQIERLENRKRHLTHGWMVHLAAVLDCEPADLMTATALTDPENRAIGLFRQLNDAQREAVILMISTMTDGPGDGELSKKETPTVREKINDHAAPGGGDDGR